MQSVGGLTAQLSTSGESQIERTPHDVVNAREALPAARWQRRLRGVTEPSSTAAFTSPGAWLMSSIDPSRIVQSNRQVIPVLGGWVRRWHRVLPRPRRLLLPCRWHDPAGV